MRGVIEDLETSALAEPEKALLRFVTQLTRAAATIGPDDIARLHAVGWTDEAIHDAVTVCSLFNFYNRWIDGTGVHPMPDDAHRMSARRLAYQGYTTSGG